MHRGERPIDRGPGSSPAAPADIAPSNWLNRGRPGADAGSTRGKPCGRRLIRSRFIAAILAAPHSSAACRLRNPALGIPTEASIRGLRPSGMVTMTQAFVSGIGRRQRDAHLQGQVLSVHALGSLIGLGAISTCRPRARSTSSTTSRSSPAPGSRARAASPSPPGRTAKSGSRTATASIMRLSAAQAGLTFSQGRYELYIQLSQ